MSSAISPALKFVQVAKAYDKKQVLRSIDLTINPGEFMGLVGVNGAGKTTLLKCMLDFCETDAGTIEIFGVDHHKIESREQLSFLPERFTPPYYLTGRDFLKYALELQNLHYDKVAAQTVLQELDLDLSALDRSVRDYSKGMTQKLGLAASFLANKKLYVLDEPMSGLDPKARALLKQRLLASKQAGATLFFSSHSLADIEEICDRMAILHDGQLRFVGTPQQCLEQFKATNLEQAFLQSIA